MYRDMALNLLTDLLRESPFGLIAPAVASLYYVRF